MVEKSSLVHLLTLTLFSELKGWVIERRSDMSQLANPREKVSKNLKRKKYNKLWISNVSLPLPVKDSSEFTTIPHTYPHFFTLFNPTPITRQPQA